MTDEAVLIELGSRLLYSEREQLVKRIKLDAYKAGMTAAANVIPKHELPKGMQEGSPEAYHWSNGYVTAAASKHHAILRHDD